MVEGARLERVYTAMYRRFESSRFRQEVKKTRKGIFYFFEEETRIRAQVRMERSDIPSSSRFRQEVKMTREGYFLFLENADSRPRIPLSRYSEIKLSHLNLVVSSLNIVENHRS